MTFFGGRPFQDMPVMYIYKDVNNYFVRQKFSTLSQFLHVICIHLMCKRILSTFKTFGNCIKKTGSATKKLQYNINITCEKEIFKIQKHERIQDKIVNELLTVLEFENKNMWYDC